MMRARWLFVLLWILLGPVCIGPAWAHHVIGRPSYSLNEDSNTPPSMEVETQVGDYYVTYMVFPAFPRPGAPGRVNFYATRIRDGKPFQGKVTFWVRDAGWLHWHRRPPEKLGVQTPEDGVYRQLFQFSEKGDYLLRAEFEADGQPYQIDFPLRIGNPAPVGPIGIAVGAVMLILVSVSVIQRRRLVRLKAQRQRLESGT